MEGMSLLEPARAVGSDVVGGPTATDRGTSRGSLILRAAVRGCGLCFFVERNHDRVVLGPKRMMAISDMVETRLRGDSARLDSRLSVPLGGGEGW